MLLRGYEAGYKKDRDVNGEAIVEYQYYECPNCHGRFDYVNVVEKKRNNVGRTIWMAIIVKYIVI